MTLFLEVSAEARVREQVVGVHDDASEVLFDVAFAGGSDLHGRCVHSNHFCGHSARTFTVDTP